jgi:CheY-like chemotaxis protein
MTMPNMTGLELARALMGLRPEIPVILCTGFSGQLTEDRAKLLGLRELIMKPVVLSQIAESVRRVLDKG